MYSFPDFLSELEKNHSLASFSPTQLLKAFEDWLDLRDRRAWQHSPGGVQDCLDDIPSRMSDLGIEFLKQWEKFAATPYDDQAGNPTVGYGHKIRGGESFNAPVSEADAVYLLRQDVRTAEEAVAKAAKECILVEGLKQGPFDALTSLTFNIGVFAFENSTIRRMLTTESTYEVLSLDRAFDAIRMWNKVTINGVKQVSDGLVRRREAEILLWQGKWTPPA